MSEINTEQFNYDPDEALKLKNQLCFPLYAAARRITSAYTPVLKPLGLTYTQYIVLLVLWEEDGQSVSDICEKLLLDSGTITPVLKKLEQKGLIVRRRDSGDERILNITVTDKGMALRDKAVNVPERMACSVKLTPEEAVSLCTILHKLLSDAE